MAYIHKFGQVSIICHAFNENCTEMAVSVNSNDVFIFQVPEVGRGKFAFLHRLQQHTATVRSIDWGRKKDRIVSCSTDRNAYVWSRSDKTWKPTLVILQLNRAATFVRWSPLENKFAVGSSAKVISVCSFESDNDFWVSKHLKKGINSTITCLDWHPDNNVLACGSTDFHVRVFSAYVKSNDTSFKESNWGVKLTFNSLLWESEGGLGWVHSIAFSNDGNKLIWCTHSSAICVATVTGSSQPPAVSMIAMDNLPLLTLIWAAPNTVIGAGHDCVPYTIYTDKNQLRLGTSLDSKEESNANTTMSAKARFQQIDRVATEVSNDSTINSKHKNAINEIRTMKCNNGAARVISTIGRDGQLIVWDLNTITQKTADVKIF